MVRTRIVLCCSFKGWVAVGVVMTVMQERKEKKINKGCVRMGDPYDEIFEHAVTMN